MIVTPRLSRAWQFAPHPWSGVRHTGVLVFAPTTRDWTRALAATEKWYQRGWCTYDERQLVLNDVWRAIDSAGTVKGRIAG